MAEMVGSVTAQRYAELVTEGRDLVELASRAQFSLGDKAIEIVPVGPVFDAVGGGILQ